MPGPLHPKLGVPSELYSCDIVHGPGGTMQHFPIVYNALVKLYDELDKLKVELEQKLKQP